MCVGGRVASSACVSWPLGRCVSAARCARPHTAVDCAQSWKRSLRERAAADEHSFLDKQELKRDVTFWGSVGITLGWCV